MTVEGRTMAFCGGMHYFIKMVDSYNREGYIIFCTEDFGNVQVPVCCFV